MESCKFDHIFPHTYRRKLLHSCINGPNVTKFGIGLWKIANFTIFFPTLVYTPVSMGWMLHGRNAPSPTTLCTSVTFPPGKVDLSGISRQSQGENQYSKIKFGLFSNNIHLVVCLHCPFIILYSLITGFQLLFSPVVFRTKLLNWHFNCFC